MASADEDVVHHVIRSLHFLLLPIKTAVPSGQVGAKERGRYFLFFFYVKPIFRSRKLGPCWNWRRKKGDFILSADVQQVEVTPQSGWDSERTFFL